MVRFRVSVTVSRVMVRVRDSARVRVMRWIVWHTGGTPNVTPKMPTQNSGLYKIPAGFFSVVVCYAGNS